MNIGWIIGLALAVTITTIRNERMVKEYREKQKLDALKKNVDLEIKPAKVEKIEKVEKKEITKKKKEKKRKES